MGKEFLAMKQFLNLLIVYLELRCGLAIAGFTGDFCHFGVGIFHVITHFPTKCLFFRIFYTVAFFSKIVGLFMTPCRHNNAVTMN